MDKTETGEKRANAFLPSFCVLFNKDIKMQEMFDDILCLLYDKSTAYKGGDRVVQETIQTVRDAEVKAAQVMADAELHGEKLITEAKATAGQLQEEKLKAAKEKAQAALEKAKTDGEALLSAAESEVASEISVIRQTVAAKEDEAIRLILTELI